MTDEIPEDHPRRASLLVREKLVEAEKQGLLAPVAMIAHGRGEAYDYLIGEKTTFSAKNAIKLAAQALLAAKNPVISINGNTAVLCRENLWELALSIPCPLEVNIFYRTPERMKKLVAFLSHDSIEILGEYPDATIPGLSSERARCTIQGIYNADVILVPLEDGDRCEALRKMGKFVIAIDLNPFTRTSYIASLTIVDNVTRCIPELTKEILKLKANSKLFSIPTVENDLILNAAVDDIKSNINNFKNQSIYLPEN